MGNGKIVTLCGSARFLDAFNVAAANEVLDGNVVFGLSCKVSRLPACVLRYMDKDKLLQGLVEGHRKKIEMSDEILVINDGGYIGEQTKEEIEYAKKLGKTVRYFQNG